MPKPWFYYEARRSEWLQISFDHLVFYNWCLQSKYAVCSWILLPSKCDRESNPPTGAQQHATLPAISYHGRDSKCNLSASNDTFEERNAVGEISECACQGALRRSHVFAARLFTFFFFLPAAEARRRCSFTVIWCFTLTLFRAGGV